MKYEKTDRVTFADDIYIQGHEGVLSSSLTLHIYNRYNPEKNPRVVCGSNCKEMWDFIKTCYDRGIPVYTQENNWGGKVEIEDWGDTLSYAVRYGK